MSKRTTLISYLRMGFFAASAHPHPAAEQDEDQADADKVESTDDCLLEESSPHRFLPLLELIHFCVQALFVIMR